MDYEPQGPPWETDEPTMALSETETQQNRRSLLGALGGMTLAASGLLLPEWLVADAGAEGHPVRRVQHRKTQRHKKHRNERKRRRQQDDDKPRGRDFFDPRNMAIAVHNYRANPVRVRGWQLTNSGKWEMPTVWDWKDLPARTGATEFVSAYMRVVVQIGTNYVVDGYNQRAGFPMASIATGGWGVNGSEGGLVVTLETAMWVNRTIWGDNIWITRVGDTEEHILFSVDLGKGPS